jgi:hypothetical protein
MAQDLACPGCLRGRRDRALRVVVEVLLVLSVLAGFAMLGVLFLVSMDPFAGESGPIPWFGLFVVALLPWVAAIGLVLAHRWIGRQLVLPAPAPPMAERLYREANLDLRCPQHRGQ